MERLVYALVVAARCNIHVCTLHYRVLAARYNLIDQVCVWGLLGLALDVHVPADIYRELCTLFYCITDCTCQRRDTLSLA